MKKQMLALALIILLTIPFASYAVTPMETVRADINKVLDVLRDPSLKGESGKKIKKTKIRSLAKEMFGFDELSRRTLGQNWKRLNADQQKEFTDLYASLLEETYANRLLSYTNEKVRYGKETPLSGKTVEVETTIVTTQGADIPINYRVVQKDGDWKVYDVVIEGVSLIDNYRSQFNRIIKRESYDALVKKMRRKLDEDNTKSS